ncbi:MAG: type II toxin-antitoxin system VapC family toxin [Treponema sp.]|nr:type II toxin-antitoxin system VapC family toxin [Treponema sp.]MBR0476597.1 type II toxin-antitoxin system VapC family toxin [Treponema sp.]
MYYLDSNVIIDATTRKTASLLLPYFEKLKPSQICIPSIVLAELEFGARHSKDYEKNLKIVSEFIAPFRIIPFSEKEASSYGKIREQLTKDGKLIGPNDMLIAATALANEAVLVTHNTDEFSRVKGLSLEDWRK